MPKIMITALDIAEKDHLQSRTRVKREKALRMPIPTVYCGAEEELGGSLRVGMLSRDAMGWAGCDAAHLAGVSRKIAFMQEGTSAISQRPFCMRKHRLVVEDGDLDLPKPGGKSLRTSAHGSRQQLSDDLHSNLRV